MVASAGMARYMVLRFVRSEATDVPVVDVPGPGCGGRRVQGHRLGAAAHTDPDRPRIAGLPDMPGRFNPTFPDGRVSDSGSSTPVR